MANGKKPRFNLFDSRLSSRFYNPVQNQLNIDTSLMNYGMQNTSQLPLWQGYPAERDSIWNNAKNIQSAYQDSVVQAYEDSVYNALPNEGDLSFIGPSESSMINTDQGMVPESWMEPATEPINMPSWDDFENMTDDQFINFVNTGENPIVAQATQNTTEVNNSMLQGPPVTGSGNREIGITEIRDNFGKPAESQFALNINQPTSQSSSIDFGDRLSQTLSAGQVPMPGDANYSAPSLPEINSANAIPEDITGMSFEEFMTPPISGEELMNNPAYNVDFGTGGGGLTDVTANQFVDPASQTGALSKISGAMDKLGGATNVLGAGMMVGGNLAAMGQYGDAIGDVEEGLAEIPGMLSETMTSAQRETENVRDLLTSQVESTADASNTKLQQSLNQLASNPQQAVGNVKSKSNEIRRNLAEGIDMALANASERFDMQSERIQEGKRQSIDAIESMKAELKAKKKELEKEKEQAKWGAIVGAGSLVADAFLPGSGQLIRSGYSQYASRT